MGIQQTLILAVALMCLPTQPLYAEMGKCDKAQLQMELAIFRPGCNKIRFGFGATGLGFGAV